MEKAHRHFLTDTKQRTAFICALAIFIGAIAMLIAKTLLWTLALMTNFFYFQRFSLAAADPGQNTLGYAAALVPVVGGLIVGLMARFGSSAIRGHGIPEAMENILLKESRIPRRIVFLKPLSAAVAIGSGGPFGAEGPIIATGGAAGSWLGQVIHVTPYERKILLACGAAAGMTAIFGTPLSGVLLAIELLLFEFRHKSFVPVALAASAAASLRFLIEGTDAFVPMADIATPSLGAIAFYLGMGVVFGMISPLVTRSIYWIEDQFERIPVPWMWWPAIGGLVVGLIGLIRPETLGVGYSNITHSLNGDFTTTVVAGLVLWKFLSWSIALGSGTSGGTLAPLMTLGAGMGLIIGRAASLFMPAIDPHIAALVGMAALFTGCSHALLASVVFAVEVTKQPLGLVPLLGSCSVSYMVATLMSPYSIMTEKIVRRGVHVPHEYYPD